MFACYRKNSMNKLCRQVSIESPGPLYKDCVFSFEVPVPDVPPTGARIKVVCAGACYRMRPRSLSTSSQSSVSSIEDYNIPAHHGMLDGALFPGYEVAGVIDTLGSDVVSGELSEGKRVVRMNQSDIPRFSKSSNLVIGSLSL